MIIPRHVRQDIQEALQAGYKAPEIMQLLEEQGVTHAHVTRERRHMRMGKWGKKQLRYSPWASSQHRPETLEKLSKVREMLLQGIGAKVIRSTLRIGRYELIQEAKEDLMRQGYQFNRRGKLLNPNHVPATPSTQWYDKPYTGINTAESGAAYRRPKQYKGISNVNTEDRHGPVTIVQPALDSEPQESVISPVDYVNAFEARVMEYHKEIEKLRAENKRLSDDNKKLCREVQQIVHQARNFQPNSLIRTSLSNGG